MGYDLSETGASRSTPATHSRSGEASIKMFESEDGPDLDISCMNVEGGESSLTVLRVP